MLATDAKTVKGGIKMFDDFSDDQVNSAIAQARAKAKADDITADQDVFNLAIINYARHVLNVDHFNQYGVVSANDLGQSETLANPNTYDDAYLKAYNDIADNYGATGGDMTFYNRPRYKNVF